MTWNVIRNGITGELILLESTQPIPEGWVLEAITCNPEYLDYLNAL